jgi:uroporphyrinogen III methyltransferase/synthase
MTRGDPRPDIDNHIPDPGGPTVFLVGAGPGNPGLLTQRAVECLRQADLVVYDKLVPTRLLMHARPEADRLCVAELSDCHAERYQPVQKTLIEAARQGRRVVRLKGGDPFLFGRGGEEAEALRQAGIPYEVVPGVTAALGAAACAGIPLTHRAHASAVAFVTGHENPAKGESALDWQALARFPGTLVVYMGISRLGQIVRALIDNGKPADTPAAAVHWATTGEQQTVTAPLREIATVIKTAGLTPPAVVIVGQVTTLRPRLAWLEQRPLFGKRVLVTRPAHQAADMARRLEELGAVPILLPAIEVQAPANWSTVDDALSRLASFQWLVFTSTNGVQFFLGRLRATGRDLRALGSLRLAAIGQRTAEALRSYHLEPDLVPAVFRSEELAAELRDKVAGQRVLLARADRGRDVLPEALAAVAEVEQVAVYRQANVVEPDPAVLDALRRAEIDFVTLTSPAIARAFLGGLDAACRNRLQKGEVKVVTISPVTSAAVRELAIPVAAEAAVFTAEGIVATLIDLCCQGPERLSECP